MACGGTQMKTLSTSWQPIETAPRDGTEILAVWFEHPDRPDYSIVEWSERGWVGKCDGSKAIESEGYWGTKYRTPFVTHWMPLPEPPKGGN